MKDAFGHGSNPHNGGSSLTEALRARLPGSRLLNGSGGQPMSSNAAAADALASTLKATQAPVHPAMALSGQSAVRDLRGDAGRGSRSFGRPIGNLKGVHH